MILLAVALGLGSALGENRLWWGEVELAGPLESVVVQHRDGATELASPVPAGAERSVRVPLSARVPADEPARLPEELEWSGVAGSGTARFAGWEELQPSTGWKRVTPGLRARTLPPVGDGDARPTTADLSILLAVGVLGLAWRGRAGAQLGLGALGGAALWFLASEAAAPAVEVYEGEGAASWVVVTRARDRLVLRGSELRLEVDPPRRPVDFRSGARDSGASEGSGAPAAGAAWVARAPGGRLVSWYEPVSVELSRASNGFRSLAECWLRDPAGGWRALGAWDLGRALPPVPDAGQPRDVPPGWAASGLPPGRAVLVGRAGTPGGDRETWIRWVGFP